MQRACFFLQAVDVKEDRAVLEGTDTLAGSIVSMDECVQHLKNMCCTDTVEVTYSWFRDL